ncbi:hypothetical protein CLF_101930 [Clonorchis sinensis]|uniref:Uncharacterized protein n=1 Tax=Clonorchis sinensis TaxID=79923 RepID=G7Y6W5_CLOSI|nr:hypothetical protein CLF_101930 [Clonorchis sinensis]
MAAHNHPCTVRLANLEKRSHRLETDRCLLDAFSEINTDQSSNAIKNRFYDSFKTPLKILKGHVSLGVSEVRMRKRADLAHRWPSHRYRHCMQLSNTVVPNRRRALEEGSKTYSFGKNNFGVLLMSGILTAAEYSYNEIDVQKAMTFSGSPLHSGECLCIKSLLIRKQNSITSQPNTTLAACIRAANFSTTKVLTGYSSLE